MASLITLTSFAFSTSRSRGVFGVSALVIGTRDEVVLVVRAGLNVHHREPQTHKQLMGGGLGVVLEVVVGEGPPGVVPDVIRR